MNQNKFNPTYAARDCFITCPECGDCAPLSEDKTFFACPHCGYKVPADQVDDKVVDRYCMCGKRIWHGDAAPWETPVCAECVWDYLRLSEDWDR